VRTIHFSEELLSRLQVLIPFYHPERFEMKFAIFASILGMGVSAFAPMKNAYAPARDVSVSAEKSAAIPFLPKPENLEGYVGDVGFDPLRISDYVPMDYLREAELKHARICMLAWTGWVAVDLGLRIYPMPASWEGLDVKSAHNFLVTSEAGGGPNGPLGQMFVWISLAEMASWLGVSAMLQGSGRAPGDFGFDPLNFLPKDADKAANMKLKELNNGRLAMLAFAGVVTQSVLFDSHFPYTSK